MRNMRNMNNMSGEMSGTGMDNFKDSGYGNKNYINMEDEDMDDTFRSGSGMNNSSCYRNNRDPREEGYGISDYNNNFGSFSQVNFTN